MIRRFRTISFIAEFGFICDDIFQMRQLQTSAPSSTGAGRRMSVELLGDGGGGARRRSLGASGEEEKTRLDVQRALDKMQVMSVPVVVLVAIPQQHKHLIFPRITCMRCSRTSHTVHSSSRVVVCGSIGCLAILHSPLIAVSCRTIV